MATTTAADLQRRGDYHRAFGDVRFDPLCGPKSDIAPCLECAIGDIADWPDMKEAAN
jgi:hypothetical protein